MNKGGREGRKEDILGVVPYNKTWPKAVFPMIPLSRDEAKMTFSEMLHN